MSIIPFFHASGKYGFLSNWYNSEFSYENVKFCSAEQCIMWSKARLFKDENVEKMIMNTTDQKRIKSLGRMVHNFDDTIWMKNIYSIGFNAIYAKFNNNNQILKNKLLDTGDAILCEASPYDCLWGVGVSVELAKNHKNWNGKNLLGNILMDVRTKLKLN
jgi:hypothetical protein